MIVEATFRGLGNKGARVEVVSCAHMAGHGPVVELTLMKGKTMRHLNLSPDTARELADTLIRAADVAELQGES